MKEYKAITDPKHKNHSKVSDVPSFCKIIFSDDKVMEWKVFVKGPPDSAYEGHCVEIKVTASPQYPFKAPDLLFVTQMFHPNVNKDGTVCPEAFHLDAASWGPTLNFAHVFRQVQEALRAPNVDSPVNADAGTAFKKSKDAWRKKVASTLKKCAAKTPADIQKKFPGAFMTGASNSTK